jgi:hypothetical protein
VKTSFVSREADGVLRIALCYTQTMSQGVEKIMEEFLAKLTSGGNSNSEDIYNARDKAAKGGAAENFSSA